MISRRLVHLLIWIVGAVVIPAFATIEEGRFGLAQGSGEWRREELEQWFQTRMAHDIGRFLGNDKFNLYVNITFKGERSTVRRLADVNLGKFGTVATLYGGQVVKPEQGLFGKVDKLQVNLLLDKDLDESIVEAALTIIRGNIPVISQERVVVDVIRVKRPGIGLTGAFREMQGLLSVLLVLAALGYLAFRLLPLLRFQFQWSMAPAKKAKAQEKGELPELITPLEALMDNPADHAPAPVTQLHPALPVGMELQDSHLVDSLQSLELRRLRARFLELSFKDRINIAQNDIQLASVMLMVLPKEHADRLMRVLPGSIRTAIVDENLKWDTQWVTGHSKELLARTEKFASPVQDTQAAELMQRSIVYVDQIGFDQEDKYFDSILQKGQFRMLEELVKAAPPARVFAHCPVEFLLAAFQKASLKERALMVLNAPVWFSGPMQILRTKSNGKEGILEREIDSLKDSAGSPKAVNQALKAYGEFFTDLRAAYRATPVMREQLKPHIEQWLNVKTKGVLHGTDRKSA